MFYVTLADNLKNLLDGVLLFVVAGVLFKQNPLMIAICAVSYACFGAVFLYGDILARRMFGSVHSKSLMMFIKLFFVLLILIPGIVAAVVLMMAFESSLLMAVGFGGWALFAAFILFTLSLGGARQFGDGWLTTTDMLHKKTGIGGALFCLTGKRSSCRI